MRMVQAARRLGGLPALAAAIGDGEAGLGHVTTVTSAAATLQRRDALAGCDRTLAELAPQATPREVTVAVKRCDAVDPGGGDPAPLDDSGRDGRRELHLRRGYDGMFDLYARLAADVAEQLATLLDTLAQPDPADTPAAQRRTPAQRRANAFADILARALASGLPTHHGRPRPGQHGRRPGDPHRPGRRRAAPAAAALRR